jgi:glycosyltransferase involved in cell wall biosynthesis
MVDSPTALVFYHYLYPDDVVSAVHVSELCRGLAERGWRVTARPSNRGCRDEKRAYPAAEDWNSVRIRRIKRPRFRQSSTAGRIFNILWMLAAWSLDAVRIRPAPDVLIIGTDPVLSILVAIVWRAVRPNTRIVHWCFDLYPEAAFADGLLQRDSLAGRLLRALVGRAYRCCDLIADIGSCMREQIEQYGSHARQVTLVPWALEEPQAPLPVSADERASVFGDAAIGLMYSGNYGRAHTCSDLLTLSRSLRDWNALMAFSVRGNRVDALKSAITADDSNIRFVPFAEASRLQERLSAADVHIVCLREEWTGTVVPSKFFGALAIGRPVLFFGSRHSSVAEIIQKYRVGWVWDPENPGISIDSLCRLATNVYEMDELSRRCHSVYQRHFSRGCVLDQWNLQLRRTLE